MGTVARVGYGVLEAGEKFDEAGDLADSAVVFAKSTVGLRRATGRGAKYVTIKVIVVDVFCTIS